MALPRQLSALLALLPLLILALEGCLPVPRPVLSEPTATPIATTPPSPLPTATATATPRPLPRPATEALPVQVTQGHPVFLLVRAEEPWQLTGLYRGEPLYFTATASGYWALLPVAADAPTGLQEVTMEARRPGVPAIPLRATFMVLPAQFPVEDLELVSAESRGALAASGTEQLQINHLFQRQGTAPRWQGPFLLPVSAEVSSAFGTLRSYNGVLAQGYHQGTDFAAPAETPVAAANHGRVVLARTLATRGNAVILDHGFGVYTGYYHLARIAVSEGAEVTKGDLLGYVGSTGLATGPHLHWELRIGPVPLDPLAFVERTLAPP